MRPCRLTLALSLVLAVVSALSAANWPRFRGPNGAGVADDKDIPVRWTEKDILWKVEVPPGNSSPVIWGNKLFMEAASPDGQSRSLLCLDVATGKTIWQQAVAGNKARIHTLNSLASSTPAIDGKRVVAVFWDGKEVALYAYDLEGKALWQRDLGEFKSQHGAGTSPILFQDAVYLANDQDGSAVLVALDAKDGKDLWKAERKAFRTCYSTPFIHEKKDGSSELIVASTAGITGYDPRTGAQGWQFNWSFSGMALRTVSSPIAADGMVFATSGDGSGARHAVAVKLGGKGDVTKTNLAWENRSDLPYVPCLLAKDGYLFSIQDNKVPLAQCHVAKTGELVWSERLSGKFSASPILIDGKVYAINERGEAFVFEAAAKYKLLAKNAMGEGVMATPAVADGRLFIRCKEHLFCIGKAK